MTSDEMVSIRSVQHYMYCPHRWGLIEINRSWQENYFVVKANLLHSRVHTVSEYQSKSKKVYSSVNVWNDDIGIYGVTDCIEVRNNQIYVVEYKPKKPNEFDYFEEDAIQVFAQKICVDSIFNTKCNAEIYYSDVKKHIALPFSEQYDNYLAKLQGILSEIRYNIKNGIIPQINKNQYCNGCSMFDICMPKTKHFSVRKQIEESVNGL